MTYSVDAQTARVAAAEVDAIFRPRRINGATRYPLIGCHGAGSSWDQFFSSTWTGMQKLMAYAARRGVPGIVGHFGGETFGNSTGQSRVGQALTAVSAATGCSNAKAHLVGVSMGNMVACQYAVNNPTKVASITGFIPMSSLLTPYKQPPPAGTEANAAGNLTQAIATAWGRAYRTVTDAVTNGTAVLTSATAAFVAGDVGKYIVSKAANGIAAGTTIVSVDSGTQITMSAAATTSGTGRIIGIAEQHTAAMDLLTLAAAIDSANIPVRLYYAPDDTLIVPADVTGLATAMGDTASATATAGGGHTNTGAFANFDFEAWVTWLIANGG